MLDVPRKAPTASKLMARLRVPLLGAVEGAVEGVGLGDMAPTAEPVVDTRARIAAAERVLRPLAEAAPDVDVELVEHLIRDAELALTKLEAEGAAADLGEAEVWATEAVIEVDGSRPVLFVQDGTIDVGSPDLAEGLGSYWLEPSSRFLDAIGRVVASVGAVQLPAFENKRIGTAFAIAPGLVVTNRHVLEAIARFEEGVWTWRYDAEVDFVGEYERPGERRFQLHEVVLTGPDPINGAINYGHLDLAVLSVRDNGADFPVPLSFDANLDRLRVGEGRSPPVYVVGFPAKPHVLLDELLEQVPPGRHEYRDVLERLFKSRFGAKRWAPGTIDAGPGQVAGDARKWIMLHDASTLGGNSGSCVVEFGEGGEAVVGLHFGGRPRAENYAHAVSALKDELGDLDIRWV